MLSKILSKLRGVFSDSPQSELDFQRWVRWEETWRNEAAVTGTNAISERCVTKVKMTSRLVGATLEVTTATTAHAADYLTLLVDVRRATDYTTAVNLITFAMDTPTTDNLVAFTPKDLYNATYGAGAVLPGAAFDLSAGDMITVEVTKAGTGLAFPVGSLRLVFEPRDVT